MIVNIFKTKSAVGILAICLGTACGLGVAQTTTPSKDVAQPTGTTGATAFQPGGAAQGEAQAGSAQNGNAGMQTQAKPGFDNKPPKGAKATCHNPQGGVDASGGENVSTASKRNTSCTGSSAKNAKKSETKPEKKAD